MTNLTVAVLLTCYNRRQKTLDCLANLSQQKLEPGISLTIYLVDDASTDGTGEAVKQAYPDVKILSGNGQLFWTGGMRFAFAEALKSDYDFYLWLNDDTLLYPDAVAKVTQTWQIVTKDGDQQAIVVGSTCDPETGEFTYGGSIRSRWWHPTYFAHIQPTDEIQSCETMNGNFVLIPRAVVQVVGNIDGTFKHYVADYDYGLRASRQGCKIWIAPGYIGTCSANPHNSRYKSGKSFTEQLQQIDTAKGLALQDVTLQPFDEWKVFSQRHAGPLWPLYWILPYRRLILLYLIGKLKLKKA